MWSTATSFFILLKGELMSRQAALDEITQMLGGVPTWVQQMPDDLLEHHWGVLRWFLGDSALSARDKALAAYGAAAANGCQY